MISFLFSQTLLILHETFELFILLKKQIKILNLLLVKIKVNYWLLRRFQIFINTLEIETSQPIELASPVSIIVSHGKPFVLKKFLNLKNLSMFFYLKSILKLLV